MKIFKYTITIIISGLISIASVYGQDEKETVRKFIQEFQNHAVKLRMHGNSEANEILKYISSNYTMSATRINIKNMVTHERLNFKEITAVVNQMRATNLTLKRKINNLDEVYVRDNLAFATYSSDYHWYEEDRLISHGRQFVNMILKKYPEKGWLVEVFNFVDADDQSFKGKCITGIYESKGRKNILSQTLIPDGTDMDELEDNFIIHSELEPKLIQQAYKDYYWAKNGGIYKKNRDGTQGDQLGNAKTQDEAIMFLLKTEIYPDRCFSVVKILN